MVCHGPRQASPGQHGLPLLVVHEFPTGLKGLIISAMFMAMLSSLSSVYNSAATLITIDLYQAHWRPDATDAQLVRCGRLAAVLMTLLTFCWFPVLNGQNGLIFLFVQNVMSHIFPTLVVVFVLGITTVSVNTQGALAGVIVGLIVGMVQLGSALSTDASLCQDEFFTWGCMHFNRFAIVLSILVAVTSLSVSKRFPPPEPRQLAGRTIWNFDEEPSSEPDDPITGETMPAGGTTTGAVAVGNTEVLPPAAVVGRPLNEAASSLESSSGPFPGDQAAGDTLRAAAVAAATPHGDNGGGVAARSDMPVPVRGGIPAGSPGQPLGLTKAEQEEEDYMSAKNLAYAISLVALSVINLYMWS